MIKVLNNNSPNYLAQLFSHQSHYTNSRNNLYVPRTRLYLFKTSIAFAGASLWNSLPQNVKSCISLPCFKRNLHRYMSQNNLFVPRPRLDLFKTSISFAGASLWNSLPQNIKSCVSFHCFKLNLHKYIP